MTDGKAHRAARTLIGISGVFFFCFGAAFLVLPGQLAPTVEIQLSSPSAFADVRAMYGGLPLAFGVLLLRVRRDPAWLGPSVSLVLASLVGAAGARLYSIAATGLPNELVLWYLAAELLGAVLVLRVHRALGAARQRASAGQSMDAAFDGAASARG